MSGKKSAKGGKDKKKDDSKNAGEKDMKEKLTLAKLRVEALERELVLRTEAMNRANAAMAESRTRMDELEKKYEEDKSDTFAITSDMTRQYKSMESVLHTQITEKQNEITSLKEQLELMKKSDEEEMKKRDLKVKEKELIIKEQQQKMKEMAIEFGNMLKSTLDKMSERIEMTSSSWDKEAENALKQRIKEMGGGSA
eukprot:CAMPEP_0113884762 /NCGR_PEP_ID=MMETSP0780_2-20120614/10474_1 /TAXON_ID=652834 /ORGANISM="Palpitomonas bilix" /LENGTH=196 /DNA_ID=CAMNT_0000872491 /DNA_START=232 /DNA_END=823 /DNA_ORIENTATION=+ /assembly_acc=CAM_ASM_000599